MTYIDLINAFEKWLETNYLSNSSQLLWYKLIALFNRCNWAEWITVDNRRLMSIMRIDREATFIQIRNALIENKLLFYIKGKKGQPNKYKINTYNFESKNSGIKSSENSSINRSTNRRHK